jgi:SAM-dependent methyltransferase
MRVLEIGSGTGQHAVYFARLLPHLIWHASDRKDYLEGIKCWIDESGVPNVSGPLELDVSGSDWPLLDIDAVFTANSIHIMHTTDVLNLINGVGHLLPGDGDLLLYGPFNYGNRYTSDSNANFDNWLKCRDPLSGIKNFEDIAVMAADAGMDLVDDYQMPANNRILHFKKTSG